MRNDLRPPFAADAGPTNAGGRLVENVMHFARTLRAAGLPVGPGRVLTAISAVETVGVRRRDDLYWTLHAVFVNRRDQRELFDRAFHIFWRNPRFLERLAGLSLSGQRLGGGGDEDRAAVLGRRVIDAPEPSSPGDDDGGEAGDVEADAALGWSSREVLRHVDFETMSAEEEALARKVIAAMRLPIVAVPTRRFAPDPRGPRIDMRASLRAALRSGGDIIPLRLHRPRPRHPPLVVLCDISGSMSRYSRMFLHFMHAITNDRDRVHTFLFGTRLTNVTRDLRHRDVEVALERVAAGVADWEGGTRIGHCLREFNLRWSRRVLGQGALVLFISDGLDRDTGTGLESEIERLHKSCRRLIWLNPLLRYAGFEPRPAGIRAILPHVDDFRPVHDLDSLDDLAAALARLGVRKPERTRQWRKTG